MKKSAFFIAIISLATVACTSQKMATTAVNDDVYSSSRRHEQPVAKTTQPTVSGAQVVTSPDNAKPQKPASSSFADDYNDYSYAGRINRFNSKDTTKGYFDDSYSGTSSTGGGNDPNVNISFGFGTGFGGYGSSMYFGSGWGYPYYSMGFGYGWGYPYYGMGWGYPYYGYSPWYNPYWYGYGYNDPYYGYPPYYASSSIYYGRRTSLSRTDGGIHNLRTASPVAGGSVNQNDRSRSTTVNTRNTGQQVTKVPATQETYRYSRPGNSQVVYQRNNGKVQNQAQVQRQGQGQVPHPQPAPRYTRPENATQVQRSGSAQSYSSPVYRQPKTSQEYLAPRTQSTNAARSGSQVSGSRVSSGAGYRQSGTPSQGRSYSAPSGSSGSPSQGRSGSTYSTPARSGGSNNSSSPARSGGSSGGSSGSGGGHRR